MNEKKLHDALTLLDYLALMDSTIAQAMAALRNDLELSTAEASLAIRTWWIINPQHDTPQVYLNGPPA